MFTITILTVIIIAASLAYNCHTKCITFGRKWNGEVKAILKNGRIVILEKAGSNFKSFFLPGATRMKASMILTRYIEDKNHIWIPDYELDPFGTLDTSYLKEEIRTDGVAITVIDSHRGEAVGYSLEIRSRYPFEGSKPKQKYIFTDTQWHIAHYTIAIKQQFINKHRAIR